MNKTQLARPILNGQCWTDLRQKILTSHSWEASLMSQVSQCRHPHTVSPDLCELPNKEWSDSVKKGGSASWIQPSFQHAPTLTGVTLGEVHTSCLTCLFILSVTGIFFSWPDFVITLLSKHHIWKSWALYSMEAPENRDILLSHIEQMSRFCL